MASNKRPGGQTVLFPGVIQKDFKFNSKLERVENWYGLKKPVSL